MSFFKKNKLTDGAKGTLEDKRFLGGEAGATTMVRKPARDAGPAGGTPTKLAKRFDRVARGAITGDLAEALDEVQAALEEDPTNDELHMRRYEVLRQVGDKVLLTRALEESSKVTGRSFYYVKLAALLEETEDFEGALVWRKRVVELNGADPDAVKKLAMAYVRTGNVAAAGPVYLHLLQLKTEAENPLGSSFLDDMTGRGLQPDVRVPLQAMGLRILNEALSTRANSRMLLEAAAHLAARSGALEASIEYFERLLAAHPTHANVRTWKGELLGVLARAGVADKWRDLSNELMLDYEEHLRINRADVRSFIALARLQVLSGFLEEALGSLKSAIRADSREWQAVYEHGKLLVRLGRSDEAVSWYEDILSPFSSDSPERKSIRRSLERSLAELYFKLGRYSESLAIYVHEEEANTRFIAQIYEAVGQLDRAEELYRKELERTPKDARAHLALAEFNVRRGNWSEVECFAVDGFQCKNAFEEVLEGLYVALATAQMNLRQVQSALETMDRAVKESPDSASMLFRKVKLMIVAKQVKQGKVLAEQVRAMLERRLACAPANSGYWSLLGDCSSLLGREDDAQHAYNTAAKFDAQDSAAVRGLGVLAERSHDLRRALDLYQRFVTLDPLNLATLPIKHKIKEIEHALIDGTAVVAAE